MSKKKVSLFVSAFMVLSVFLAACSGGAKPADNKAGDTAPKEKIKIRAMGTTVDPQRGLELWKIWEQEIEKQYTDIDVEFITPIPGINTEKLLTMVASGDAPDVLQTTNIEYAARGLLVDLTPFIERDKILTERPYFKKSVEAAKYNGKFWAVPGGLSSYVWWVNVTELEKAGFKYPQDGIVTFQELEEWSKKMTVLGPDGQPVVWGNATSSWFSRIPPLIWARGGDLFEYDAKTGFAVKSTFNTPAVIDAIQWNVDLIHKLKVSPVNSGEAEKAGFTFWAGKVGFNYGGAWIVTDGRKNIAGKFQWAPLRVPVMKKGDMPMEMVPAFTRGSILASTKNKEAAWKVLKYMSSPEANKLYAQYVTDELIFDTPEARKAFTDSKEPGNLKIMIDAAEDAGKRPVHKSEVTRVLYGWSKMTTVMTNELAPVYEGKKKVADVAKAIEDQINAIIEEGIKAGMDPKNPPNALK